MHQTASLTALLHRAFTLILASLTLVIGSPSAEAARPSFTNALNVVPTITEVSVNDDGQLVAAGNATATVRGRNYTSEFENVPINISIAEDQTGAGECPILDLELGPINLNLLGLIVETSPICLKITAYDGGGLLGDLLCSVSDLLDGGIDLGDILDGIGGVNLPALTLLQIDQLLAGVEDLLNAALDAVAGAVLTDILEQRGRTCAILNLELGPIDLTLLGLNIHLDDCEDGPVTVDISARRGQLLGNLLCGLLHGGGLDLGATLEDLVDGLLARLNR